MRVLHIGKFFAPYKGGIETHVETLCNGLAKYIDVQVVVFEHGDRKSRAETPSYPVERAKVTGTLASAPLSVDLVKIVRERAKRADIVHLHHPNPMGNLAVLLSGFKGPVVVTYHGDVVKQRFLKTMIAPAFDAMWRRTAAFLVHSECYLDPAGSLGSFRDRGHVIPLGLDLAPYENLDLAAISAIKARHPGRIILGVGRLVEFKGFSYLLQAMQSVDAQLLLLGDGPLKPRLQAEAETLGITHKVCFVGNVSAPIPYYHACDLLAVPSCTEAESFGQVQVEAMACGKPVVNTSLSSGVPWVSLNGVSGLTVPPGNPRQLAAALNLLLEDEDLRKKLGGQAKRRAFSHFGSDRMIQRTLDLYETICAQSSLGHLSIALASRR